MGNCCLRAFTGGASGAGLAAEDGANKKTKTAGATALSWLLGEWQNAALRPPLRSVMRGTLSFLHCRAWDY